MSGDKTIFSKDTTKKIGDKFPVVTPRGTKTATVTARLEETHQQTAHGSDKPIGRGYYKVKISED